MKSFTLRTNAVTHTELVFLIYVLSGTAHGALWCALLVDNKDGALAAMSSLGVPAKFYDVLSVALTFRLPSSLVPVGNLTAFRTKAGRAEMKARIKAVLREAGDLNALGQVLPRDMLYVLRSTFMVQSINARLGGSTQGRLRTSKNYYTRFSIAKYVH